MDKRRCRELESDSELKRYNIAGMEIMIYLFHCEDKNNSLRIADILDPFDSARKFNATDNFVNSPRGAIKT